MEFVIGHIRSCFEGVKQAIFPDNSSSKPHPRSSPASTGIDDSDNFDEEPHSHPELMFMACRAGDLSTVQKILLSNIPTDLELVDENGETALIIAIKNSHLSIVEDLLLFNADLMRKINGKTALQVAAGQGNQEIYNLLLERATNSLAKIQ
jgi:ankyrin repeat protein